MRRPLAALVAVLTMSALTASSTVLGAQPATADPGSDGVAVGPSASVAEQAADEALDRAADLLSGEAAPAEPAPEASDPGTTQATETAEAVSPTLALRDLFVALPRLDAGERTQADALLARPTDGDADPNGDGYTVPARRDCAKRVCIHWVNRTKDAPPSRRWVGKSLRAVQHVWNEEVGRLGYRPPVRDRGRGGNGKLDVYLKDVGSEGFYGYCVPERRAPGRTWVASGYCVLDDDFARSQFHAKPVNSLRVTAAHEFFHAVQFAYDYAEDGWLMEATATWAEERVADSINDNRQYLPYGQVHNPARPLDRFDQTGFGQYGNFAFFEYLSERFGTKLVRRIWENAAGDESHYSTVAVKRSLPGWTSFPDVFRAYAAGNLAPGRTYEEGAAWPRAGVLRTHTLTASRPAAERSVRIDHMAAKNVAVRHDDTLTGRRWQLRIRVDGPAGSTSPAAYVLVHKASGAVMPTPVKLNRQGVGAVEVPFGKRSVSKVTLTLANASTKFDCWHQQLVYSCQGRPRNDNQSFTYRVQARQRR